MMPITPAMFKCPTPANRVVIEDIQDLYMCRQKYLLNDPELKVYEKHIKVMINCMRITAFNDYEDKEIRKSRLEYESYIKSLLPGMLNNPDKLRDEMLKQMLIVFKSPDQRDKKILEDIYKIFIIRQDYILKTVEDKQDKEKVIRFVKLDINTLIINCFFRYVDKKTAERRDDYHNVIYVPEIRDKNGFSMKTTVSGEFGHKGRDYQKEALAILKKRQDGGNKRIKEDNLKYKAHNKQKRDERNKEKKKETIDTLREKRLKEIVVKKERQTGEEIKTQQAAYKKSRKIRKQEDLDAEIEILREKRRKELMLNR